MRLGMNMLLWTTTAGEPHFGVFEELREIGFDGIEVAMPPGHPADPAGIAAKFDELGFARTACTSMEPDTDPVSPYEGVREAAKRALIERLDRAAAFGAETVVGPFHSAYKQFSGQPPTEDELARSAEVLRVAAEHAETLGIKLAIEYLNRFECYLVNTAADALALIERVDHPALGILYDTHHAHIEEPSVEAAISAAGKRIHHVHVSENHRGTPGEGQVAWDATFKALKAVGYDGWLVIEAFGRSDPDFAAAIHVWRDYAESPTALAKGGHDFLREAWARA